MKLLWHTLDKHCSVYSCIHLYTSVALSLTAHCGWNVNINPVMCQLTLMWCHMIVKFNQIHLLFDFSSIYTCYRWSESVCLCVREWKQLIVRFVSRLLVKCEKERERVHCEVRGFLFSSCCISCVCGVTLLLSVSCVSGRCSWWCYRWTVSVVDATAAAAAAASVEKVTQQCVRGVTEENAISFRVTRTARCTTCVRMIKSEWRRRKDGEK